MSRDSSKKEEEHYQELIVALWLNRAFAEAGEPESTGDEEYYDALEEALESSKVSVVDQAHPANYAPPSETLATNLSLNKNPLVEYRVSSAFKMRRHPLTGEHKMHKGIDVAAPTGTALHAATNATVAYAGKATGYGNIVILSHGSGVYSLYAHLDKFDVRTNDRIEAGRLFARTGNTGASTNDHLHYELMIQRGGKAYNVNPSKFALADLASEQAREEAFKDAVKTGGSERAIEAGVFGKISKSLAAEGRSRLFTTASVTAKAHEVHGGDPHDHDPHPHAAAFADDAHRVTTDMSVLPGEAHAKEPGPVKPVNPIN